jgi:hypothetical protein
VSPGRTADAGPAVHPGRTADAGRAGAGDPPGHRTAGVQRARRHRPPGSRSRGPPYRPFAMRASVRSARRPMTLAPPDRPTAPRRRATGARRPAVVSAVRGLGTGLAHVVLSVEVAGRHHVPRLRSGPAGGQPLRHPRRPAGVLPRAASAGPARQERDLRARLRASARLVGHGAGPPGSCGPLRPAGGARRARGRRRRRRLPRGLPRHRRAESRQRRPGLPRPAQRCARRPHRRDRHGRRAPQGQGAAAVPVPGPRRLRRPRRARRDGGRPARRTVRAAAEQLRTALVDHLRIATEESA